MRILATAAVLALAVSSTGYTQVHVRGYTTRNGTYVAPHWRSSPDSTRLNNWSTQGNVNPYTGQVGTRNPYSLPSYGGTYGSSLYSPAPTYKIPSYGSDDNSSEGDPQ